MDGQEVGSCDGRFDRSMDGVRDGMTVAEEGIRDGNGVVWMVGV